MTTKTKTKPSHEVKLGRIKAVIWENETKNGPRFNTTFCRVYRVTEDDRKGANDDGWRETASFGRDDLLLVAKVADQVHSWIYTQNETHRRSEDA